ncbi:MAG: single-stranded-DNA-specific exonuclease RecJ [Anaerolineales bacterium]|jgi:single-stranded-DNA-specific exonuclease
MNWIEPSPLPTSTILPDLPPLVAGMLLRRGITTPAAAQAFLEPQAYSPTPAVQLPGIASVADRLEMAIRKHDSVCVWGDFDVDGQTSTAILFQTLQELNADVTFHIPVRANEGHGINIPHLQEIIDSGAKLILTCDTGITAHAAVDYARSRHVDMLITDHHELPEVLPQALAVANPNLLPEGHPLFTLSGSGVAYKLAEELYARFGCTDTALKHLDLATLGLVADLARLTGDGRYIVQCGLTTLENTHRLGLQAMMEIAELIPANLTEQHISFVLAPRLNAMGRLGDANPAVDLLTTSDTVRAHVLATQLEGLNAQRQLLCSQVTRAAEAQLLADPALLAQPVLMLGHPSWPGGVVGIVASRLVERYRKPAILFSTPAGEPASGSARSIEGLNITAAISAQKDLLLNFGGHPMAAGLSLEPEKLPEFSRRLAKTVTEMLGENEIITNLEIDAWLNLPDISMDLVDTLERLAPFGPGNETPILATHALQLQSAVTIGRNQEHLKLRVVDETGNSQTVLWWNGAEEKDRLPEGHFDLAYSLRTSDWRGLHQIQMEFVDFHSLETEKIEVLSRKLEVIDFRNATHLPEALSTIQSQPSTILWAEGVEKKECGGKDRNELSPANTLLIWTIPPSPEELHIALEKVHPCKVYLFAVTEPVESPEAFIERLSGLLKYAINRRAGKCSFSELASATAQRAVTVRKGLQWLASQGEINITMEGKDDFAVFLGASLKKPLESSRLWAEIQSLLAESAAYRTYFKRADKDALLA